MTAKFEVVRTEAGYHGRIKGGNSETTWTTEVLESKQSVYGAMEMIPGVSVQTEVVAAGQRRKTAAFDELGYVRRVEITETDERPEHPGLTRVQR